MYMPEPFQLTFNADYSRLDRGALTEAFKEDFPSFTDSRIREMTRAQLISLISESSAVRASTAEQIPPPIGIPLHRTNTAKDYDLPKSLVSAQSMYYCWEDQSAVVDAAISLAKGDVSTREWNLGEDVPQGSLLLTVLGTTPPLVTALETVTTVTEEKVYVEQIAVFAEPISLYDLESLIDSGLPRSSKPLSIPTAKRVLKSLSKLINDPKPLIISAGQCGDDAGPHFNDAVHVLALLQREYNKIQECDGCGRDVEADTTVHFFRPSGENLVWDVQDHVGDAGLLCHDCHAVVHGPTKTRLRQIINPAPRCPECGEGNPKIALWGDPAIFDDDNYVTKGCALPLGPASQWVCRNCDTEYAVVANPQTLMPADMVKQILGNRS